MDTTHTRRTFIKTASLATSAVAMTAASYARVPGANDRIRLAMIGCGSRGRGAHMVGVHPYDKEQNVEFVAVCDPWKPMREDAAQMVKDWYGIEAKQCSSYLDIMAMDDVDAVMIASPDFWHTRHLKAAAEAKKDAYCEKPLSKDLPSLIAACDAVKANGIVCQIGTQLRSFPSFTGCKAFYETGALGKVMRVEQHRNDPRPYWYSRLADAKEEDVDWKEFLGDLPMRPFRADQFTGWYGYRDFSDGATPGFGTHFIDLVNYITGSTFPISCVSMGGIYVWDDEHKFTAPDQAQVLWQFPGFLVDYVTNFGNSEGRSFKIFGTQGTMDMLAWENPFVTPDGAIDEKKTPIKKQEDIAPVAHDDHILDWLKCIRNRQTPNASIDAGYQHAVAVIMAMNAMDTGKRMIYDQEKREIREG